MAESIVRSVRKTLGVAGQVSYTANVKYPGEPARSVTFVGSVYSGPVVMIPSSGVQTFVTNPGRFGGKFDAKWVRAFFASA